jgi:hypothetical protein
MLRSSKLCARPTVSRRQRLLWTDADGQWAPLIPTMQKVLPQLYVLGAYAPRGTSRADNLAPLHRRADLARGLPAAAGLDGLHSSLALTDVARDSGGRVPNDKGRLEGSVGAGADL